MGQVVSKYALFPPLFVSYRLHFLIANSHRVTFWQITILANNRNLFFATIAKFYSLLFFSMLPQIRQLKWFYVDYCLNYLFATLVAAGQLLNNAKCVELLWKTSVMTRTSCLHLRGSVDILIGHPTATQKARLSEMWTNDLSIG